MKCSRTHHAVGVTPLLNQIGGLEAYHNLLRSDMSSRFAGPLAISYYLETESNNI